MRSGSDHCKRYELDHIKHHGLDRDTLRGAQFAIDFAVRLTFIQSNSHRCRGWG
jgi:hypothetical protein